MTAVFLGLSMAALGAQPEEIGKHVYQIDIDRGPLNSGLKQLALQTDVQVARYSDNEPRNVAIGPLHGRWTLEQALTELLAGTGLTYQFVNGRMVSIVNVPTPAAVAGASNKDATPSLLTRVMRFFAVCTAAAASAGVCAQSAIDAAAASGAQPEVAEVVVTGSRVITNGNDSPTPVTVMQAEELNNIRPGTVADALYTLPVFQGSINQTNTTSPTGAAGGGNPTASTLNLRNLGSTRVLVLFDGQRVVPTLSNQIVDVDTIPQMLIQRVDVVTGGASAVYGSDAVSGVVNFVVDKNFNGIKADANMGVSSHSDDRSYRAGIAAGAPLFGGRGHVEGSYSYYDSQGIPLRTDRSTYNNTAALGSVSGSTSLPGSAANPLEVFQNVRNAQTSFGGVISNGVLSGMNFATNGVLVPFVHGTKTGTSNEEIGGDGAYNNDTVVGDLRYNQLYGRFDFDVSDDVKWHNSVFFNQSHNSSSTSTTALNPDTFSAQNPFLAGPYQAQLAAAGQSTFQLRKTFDVGALPYPELVANETQYQINSGLEGKLGTYDWGVDLNYGESKMENTIYNNVNNQRLAAALDVINVGGTTTCRALANNPGCVPFNAFGPTAASQDAINYVLGATDFTPRWRLMDTNGHFTGTPFNDWAGPVKVALSAEWRELTYSATTTPGANPSTFANCTGIAFNCTQGTTLNWNLSYAPRSAVTNTVKEAAIEFNAPLLSDLPFAKSLEFNGAARYTSYATSGDYWTYKLGLVWHVNDELTFRGTNSRDIRAPTLYELFRPEVDNPSTNTDYLTNTTYFAISRDLPAPQDTAEIALTHTAGVVWQPTPSLSASVDAYRIHIDNAINQIMGFNQQIQQLCYSSGGSSPFCALQTRPSGNFTNTSPTNQVTAWLNYFINVATVETYGADFEVNWSGRAWDHRLNARLLGTYQPHYIFAQPGQPAYDLGDVAIPRIQLTGQANLPSLRLIGILTAGVTDHFTVSLQEHWRNAMTLDEQSPPQEYWVAGPSGNHVPSFAYTTLNMQYDFEQKWGALSVYGNIRNLFNTPAPIAVDGGAPSLGYAVSDEAGLVGRYYTFGVRAKL
jgi:outer membrane receptor protein involved in Fe transport